MMMIAQAGMSLLNSSGDIGATDTTITPNASSYSPSYSNFNQSMGSGLPQQPQKKETGLGQAMQNVISPDPRENLKNKYNKYLMQEK